MNDKRKQELSKLEEELDVKFNDISLLHNAFLHSSYVNENSEEYSNNEKLELLGDSVLAFIVNEYLYKSFPESTEGDLSRIKSIVVSEHSLAIIARKLNIGKYLLLGRGEQLADGSNRQAILADTLEALFGAYSLDSDIFAVKKFILPFLIEEINKIINNEHKKDYKTKLQLITQQKYKDCPIYETIGENGPDHKKIFHVQVIVNSHVLGSGTGNSKKIAQQDAAHIALQKIGHNY